MLVSGAPAAEGLDGLLRLPALEQVDAARVEQVGRDGKVQAAICLASLLDNAHRAREVRLALLEVDRDGPATRSSSEVFVCQGISHVRLSDDERVVALDPAVRGEDEEAEPDSEHRAVLGDRLPVELDDVTESIGVVAPPEAEPLGADPVLVRARRPRLDLLVSLCVRITRRP